MGRSSDRHVDCSLTVFDKLQLIRELIRVKGDRRYFIFFRADDCFYIYFFNLFNLNGIIFMH